MKDVYNFDESFGAADSAKFLYLGNQKTLLTGHSKGYLLIWKFLDEGLSIQSIINLQSDHPADSPYRLWNIRGIEVWKEGLIVTGSEDGDLCMVDLFKGIIVHRQKYNESAKRGINRIFVIGDYLLLSNCAVGPTDQNCWLYKIEKNRFVYLDSKNLALNEKADQVFSFDIGCLVDRGCVYVFCTTEEGLLWCGQIENERLHISDFKVVSAKGAAALAIHPEKNYVVSVGNNIELFEFSHD